ncbi:MULTISPECIES: hypothetical protein [Nocardia]|uniref:hypothetical protein n=1 Tax=Nocardia TaxID=1817 RepID=UPI0006FE17CB|nr:MULTISPECIES: hypothetical protein [Nocardia]KQY38004.1 hypothetical protein ASD42_05750 [Nocardia sp. Root136]
MNHAEHDESIGSMLASIATALREVSDKLDIVAARVQLDVPTFPVDEDLPDHIRIRRLESWAFRASQDISRLSSRLDALDNDGEPDAGRPARVTRSRREVREAAEAAERATDGLDDQQRPSDPLSPHRNRDDDGSRPPLERRNSPARPTTDHLGDPTALAATPVPRTETAASFGQPASFDSDPVVAAGGNGGGGEPPSRRPAPTRLSGAASTGSASGERVGAASVGNRTSTNGTNGAAYGVAGDIASPRNGTPVPAVIGTVLTAPAVERTPGPSAPASTRATTAALVEDRTPTSGPDDANHDTASGSDTAAIATLPGSADVSTVVREGDVTIGGANGFGLGSGAMKDVSGSPVEAQSARTESGDPLTGEISSDAGIERARPAKKPTEDEAARGDRLGVPSPDRLSSNGNGVTSAQAGSGGNTANGIHWSFTEEPTPTIPDRNDHARNGFTTGSTRRAESLFDDFTPHDRLTTGETPEPQIVSGPPPRLTPPTELTTQPNHVSVDPPRVGSSSHGSGTPDISDSPASPSRPANTGGLPGHNGRPDHAPLTSHAAPTNHDHPADDPAVADPPTLGLPTGRGLSTSPSDPLERPVADPIPPTATDSAGITVTGTYRAFDIERAHVDKLQAMLDELKRSAGLPPGRRDVFGPPTPDLG